MPSSSQFASSPTRPKSISQSWGRKRPLRIAVAPSGFAQRLVVKRSQGSPLAPVSGSVPWLSKAKALLSPKHYSHHRTGRERRSLALFLVRLALFLCGLFPQRLPHLCPSLSLGCCYFSSCHQGKCSFWSRLSCSTTGSVPPNQLPNNLDSLVQSSPFLL